MNKVKYVLLELKKSLSRLRNPNINLWGGTNYNGRCVMVTTTPCSLWVGQCCLCYEVNMNGKYSGVLEMVMISVWESWNVVSCYPLFFVFWRTHACELFCSTPHTPAKAAVLAKGGNGKYTCLCKDNMDTQVPEMLLFVWGFLFVLVLFVCVCCVVWVFLSVKNRL